MPALRVISNLKNISTDVFDEDQVDDEDAQGEQEGESADEADASRQRQAAAALLHDVGLLHDHSTVVMLGLFCFVVVIFDENFEFSVDFDVDGDTPVCF